MGVLLVAGIAFALMRRNRLKNEQQQDNEQNDALQARPGELGRRGTVLAGRGLESQHGLPRSGGWLDADTNSVSNSEDPSSTEAGAVLNDKSLVPADEGAVSNGEGSGPNHEAAVSNDARPNSPSPSSTDGDINQPSLKVA